MTTSTPTATWEAPGPGSWIRDTSHSPPAPTPFYRRVASTYTKVAYATVMEAWGGAVATLDMQFVHGDLYRRLVPLIAADRDKGKLPPKPALWLATRLHPTFRRRNRKAAETLATKPYLDVVAGWQTERHEWMAANAALTAVDPASLDDDALARHLRDLDAHAIRGWLRHHELHGADLGPIGDLMLHTQQWKLDPVAVMALLKGASPATVDASRHAERIADALREADVDPAAVRDLARIRAVPAASNHLDDYLAEFGNRVITGYDIEDLTLRELPSAICSIVRAAATGDAVPDDHFDEAEAERLATESGDAATFRELLDSARAAYGMRDDNGPLTWEWPAGLVRRAYLAAGARLATATRIRTPELAFEMDIDELADVVAGGPAPGDLTARADYRRWEAEQQGPETLGPQPDGEPDLSAFPPPLGRVMGIVVSAITMLEVDPTIERETLGGLGIGDVTYEGVARVATDPAEAIAEMEPGDILVAPWTAPSYNAVLSIAGAIVIQEGGLLCHAAVMARELELPAVIGCHDAMREIRTGDRIEVDPVAGRVRVLASATD